jgi:hypothetical protein
VQYDDKGKPLSVYYQLLTPLLLAELQRGHIESLEQQSTDRDQQAALTLLLEQNEMFKSELIAMRQQMKVQGAQGVQGVQIASSKLGSQKLTQQLAQ